MQLKGKTSAFILWILMTLASVLISAWVHNLATQTPADKEARLVKRNFDVILADLQNHLQWLAENPGIEFSTLPADVDVRLVFDQ